MIKAKTLGIVLAAFVAGAFVASPELRAYAANTVGSADIIDESILSADIKNGEVKAADIATDAVGAAEIQGVTKLLFAQCTTDGTEGTTDVSPNGSLLIICSISGVDTDDSAIAELNLPFKCFGVTSADAVSNKVQVVVRNDCASTAQIGTGTPISVIVYDK